MRDLKDLEDLIRALKMVERLDQDDSEVLFGEEEEFSGDEEGGENPAENTEDTKTDGGLCIF